MKIMKTTYKMLLVGLMCGAMTTTFTSCDDYIDVEPKGVIDEELAGSQPEKMVTAAYAMLGNCWYTYPFNLWPYGDVASDEAMKGGSGTTDTDYHAVEVWTTLTSQTPGGHMDELWYRLFCNISRCNRALVAIHDFGESTLGAELAKQREGEVLFLRAHSYYKLVQMFRKVPWIDEEVYLTNGQEQTRNDAFTYEELMQKVIADFQRAYDVLPATQTEGGRANKIAAAAYLAKCYLVLAWGDGYEATTGVDHINQEYMKKVVEYTDVVKGASQYGYLEDYGDIFLPEYKNSKESVFAVQHSNKADDNTTYGRANWSNMLNGVWGIWSCGWDFHKPSQNLVNAFKTKDGLPMFDDYEKEHNAYPQFGVNSSQKYDPRLFHTVGMPTYPYKYEKEYTLTMANSRTPNTYGYYCSMKEVPQRSKGEDYDNPWQAFGMNDYVFRFSDVLLMRAEAMIETGNIEGGRNIINKIRERASKSVAKHIAYAQGQCEIAQYDKFPTLDYARKALRWERRLELAMEGHRFFDLRRWGMASSTLNKYFETEQQDEYEGQTYCFYYKDAFFTANKNEYFPIAHNQLYYIPDLYKQNKGY